MAREELQTRDPRPENRADPKVMRTHLPRQRVEPVYQQTHVFTDTIEKDMPDPTVK